MKKNYFISLIALVAIFLMSFKPGKSPSLYEAVSRQDMKLMKELLDAGADANEKYSGAPMILWAANSGNSEMIKLLVEKGAKVDETNMSGSTALSFLVDNGEEPEILLEKNKKINEKLIGRVKGDTAKVAKWLVHEDINRFSKVADKVKTLIDLGADPNFLLGNMSVKIGTPFLNAVQKNKLEIVKVMIDSKKVNLEYRFDAWLEKVQGNVNYLSAYKYVDKDVARDWAKVPEKNTPLLEAIEKQNLELVKILVEGGANLTNGKKATKNYKEGSTGYTEWYIVGPLDQAYLVKNQEIMDYLISKGAVRLNDKL
ncbi:MAG: ankyrin repeat domain-containing protein [Bacteroidia bacterium]|nr:ankyrin repeat domain-containing protein [Bacteroidia bacterium]